MPWCKTAGSNVLIIFLHGWLSVSAVYLSIQSFFKCCCFKHVLKFTRICTWIRNTNWYTSFLCDLRLLSRHPWFWFGLSTLQLLSYVGCYFFYLHQVQHNSADLGMFWSLITLTRFSIYIPTNRSKSLIFLPHPNSPYYSSWFYFHQSRYPDW